MSIVCPFNTLTPTFNSYSTLADTADIHNYLDEDALSYYQETEPSDGPEVKVSDGNIIMPISQTSYGIVRQSSALFFWIN